MNLELFLMLWTGERPPRQRLSTWQKFLEICETYLNEHDIKNPVVVELGVMRNKQKKFYEQLLNSYHIGIDRSDTKGTPDILGNTHDPLTYGLLMQKLDGRKIDILFIDASHAYEDVKKDFELYSPMCNGIIVIDDINLSRHRRKRKRHGVWKFWDEIKVEEKYDKFLFISITQYRDSSGLGMMINK